MKVLLIAPSPPPAGGIETVTNNLVKFFHTNRDGNQLVLYNTSHPFRPVTNQSLIIRLYTGIIDSLKTYIHVIRIIKKDLPDILHLASSASLSLIKDIFIVKAANHQRIPIVLHWHFGRIPDLKKKRNWEWKLLLKVIRKSTLSVAIDNKSYRALTEAGCSNAVCIPNPLAQEIEQKALQCYGNHDQRYQNRIIFVGHIIKNKGVFELVEACTQIIGINELILIGPYEENVQKELTRIARQRNDGAWLKFTGELNMDQVLDYMVHSPVLALPSYTEGFPMVIIEAMAMGCAVIATDVGAIPEILNIGTKLPCGICIPPQKVDSLREAILELIENQSESETFGRRGMERVLNTYTMEKVFRLYRAAWENALHRKTQFS
jgi:glycosyltransferase involved in cell wall biosynthesis